MTRETLPDPRMGKRCKWPWWRYEMKLQLLRSIIIAPVDVSKSKVLPQALLTCNDEGEPARPNSGQSMWESLVVNVNKNPDKWPEPLLQMNGFEWWVKQCLIMKWDLWQNNGLQMSPESKVKCYWRIRKNNQNTSKRGGLVQQSICCSVCRSKRCARDEVVRLNEGVEIFVVHLLLCVFSKNENAGLLCTSLKNLRWPVILGCFPKDQLWFIPV